MIGKYLSIFRTVANFINAGLDGKTPATRLGLAQQPLTYEDILWPGQVAPRPRRSHRKRIPALGLAQRPRHVLGRPTLHSDNGLAYSLQRQEISDRAEGAAAESVEQRGPGAQADLPEPGCGSGAAGNGRRIGMVVPEKKTNDPRKQTVGRHSRRPARGSGNLKPKDKAFSQQEGESKCLFRFRLRFTPPTAVARQTGSLAG